MLDPHAALAASEMAACLSKSAAMGWFQENRVYVKAGVCLSIGALLAVAQPRRPEELGLLIFAFAVMAPAAFYLFLFAGRTSDLARALRSRLDGEVLRRFLVLFGFIICCVASIVFGSVILGGNFGWLLVVVALFLTILNIAQLQWMKKPTQDGAVLLTEIEGFPHFLTSVERLPMQRTDAPNDKAGLYERYLPYAVALEVEQAWGDQFVALASTFHRNAGAPGAESLYLGMWEGKPVEIVYRPQGSK
jgi:hypothetical protein